MFITVGVVNMFLNRKFILASNSLSRYRLLKNAGLSFIKMKPRCNEKIVRKKLNKKNINIKNYPKILAKEKAMSVSRLRPNYLVVGSDTTIVFEKKIVNKAEDINSARDKLKKLSGKKHQIISGVSICFKEKQIWSHQQSSTIFIKKLTDKQIEEYLKRSGKEILYSVGCYQVERFGPQIIEQIKGDFFNVLGFPLFPFMAFLKNKKA